MYIISKVNDYNFVKGKRYNIIDTNKFEYLVSGEQNTEWISKLDTRYFEHHINEDAAAKESLIKVFEKAIEYDYSYVAVLVINNIKETRKELIVFPRENFEDKLYYYRNAYDEDMKLKSNILIGIETVVCGDLLEEFEYLLEQ